MASVPSAPAAASAAGEPRRRRPRSKSPTSRCSKLGEGGFGTVLLAKKKSSGKLYALKVLEKREHADARNC